MGAENKSRDQTYTRHVSAASCLSKKKYVTHKVSLDARVRFDRTGATHETHNRHIQSKFYSRHAATLTALPHHIVRNNTLTQSQMEHLRYRTAKLEPALTAEGLTVATKAAASGKYLRRCRTVIDRAEPQSRSNLGHAGWSGVPFRRH